ncbi:hypothetical protein HAX54_019998 [Datura stramonium]|uniref:Uncharacterized protein n=1 Tax=Datura stramonium TaxID=4076 RepID=A0ABS8S2Y9_DATST|nr:hypothetical protein [Datura stramonium]
MEQEEESQPLDYSLLVDVDVEEEDKSDDIKHNSILELGRLVLLILNTFQHCVWRETRNRAFQAYEEMCRTGKFEYPKLKLRSTSQA